MLIFLSISRLLGIVTGHLLAVNGRANLLRPSPGSPASPSSSSHRHNHGVWARPRLLLFGILPDRALITVAPSSSPSPGRRPPAERMIVVFCD
jgi:hypothetical protein